MIERHEETTCDVKPAEEEVKPEVEPLPDKPKDANSEIVPNQNLTDDEIAQLILEEEELLSDKGLLGYSNLVTLCSYPSSLRSELSFIVIVARFRVNFKKLRPRASVLKQSKVIEELQNIATAEPPLVEQLRRTSVFLQKPQRPVPAPRKKEQEEQQQEDTEVESYRVVIKKQKKRSVTDRLLAKGLLKPEGASTPEPLTPEVNMENIETETKIEENDSSIDSSIVSSMPLDDSLYSEQALEPIDITCPVVSSSSLEPPIEIRQSQTSLDVEPETCTNSESNVSTVQLPRHRESVALALRALNRRKFKSFYTRGHYFRKCLFGKRSYDDINKAIKVKPSFRERFQESSTKQFQQFPRRCSIEKSSKSKIKGRYLETYLKREDNWMRRMIGLFDKLDSFPSSKLHDSLSSNREISLRKTRYAEKIVVRSVEFVAVRFRSDIANSMKSRSRIDKRLYFKGHYIRRIFWRNLTRLINYIKDVVSSGDVRREGRRRSSTMIKTKGRYLETYLLKNALVDLQDLRDRFSARSSVSSSRKKLFARTRYVERVFKKHFETLGLIVNYIRCQVLQGISDSSVVIPGCSSLNSRQTDASISSTKEDDVFFNLIRSSKDFISTEVFHRGSRRLSRSSRGSISASNLANTLRSCLFNWLPTKFVRESTDQTINDKKAMQDNDRDYNRRLSFVPTILYEGLTNRIGVDFTRLVAYAFVPCTSIILLYMYK